MVEGKTVSQFENFDSQNRVGRGNSVSINSLDDLNTDVVYVGVGRPI